MKSNIRTNHETRMQAFDLLCKLKRTNKQRKEIIDLIHRKFKIPIGTIYDWYAERNKPYGRRENLEVRPELFYILGALLGDGCIFNYKKTQHYTILVGDRLFTTKYSQMLNKCIKRISKPYIDRSKNIWFVRVNNYKLFHLFKRVRVNVDELYHLLKQGDYHKNSLKFIEGFFDAEGCVKVIKEKVRITPKICLDITNTDRRYLDVVQLLLINTLGIESRYSIQKARVGKDGHLRKTVYHLRIYRKEFVKRFFEHINTTKLNSNKAHLVTQWIKNGK